MKVMHLVMMLMWLVATPAMAKDNDLVVVPKLGVGYDAYEWGFWTYGRLDIFEVHGFRRNRQQLNPLIGGIGLDVTSNWDNLTSFGLSSVGGSRIVYASMGGAVLWDQDKHKSFDGGATLGLHTPMLSVNYLVTIKGERLATVVLVLDAKFWMRFGRNQRQLNNAMTSHSPRE